MPRDVFFTFDACSYRDRQWPPSDIRRRLGHAASNSANISATLNISRSRRARVGIHVGRGLGAHIESLTDPIHIPLCH